MYFRGKKMPHPLVVCVSVWRGGDVRTCPPPVNGETSCSPLPQYSVPPTQDMTRTYTLSTVCIQVKANFNY